MTWWDERMKEEHIVRRMLDVDIPGKRRRGRQNLRWKDACKRDMTEEYNHQLYWRPQMKGRAREEEVVCCLHVLVTGFCICSIEERSIISSFGVGLLRKLYTMHEAQEKGLDLAEMRMLNRVTKLDRIKNERIRDNEGGRNIQGRTGK